jgi:uncharacterized protein YjaG (DUF416 family)
VFFDPESLLADLERLGWRHRVAFAAACCERLLPNYAAFVQEAGWGDTQILRTAIDYIWDVVADAHPADDSEVRRLIESCDRIIPDTQDHDTISVSAALDAGSAVIETLQTLLDGNPRRIVDVASFCRDTVDMYIQDRDDLDYNTDASFEAKILEDPLMKRELERQSAILSELANNPVLDRSLLTRLRNESNDNGRSNIGRISGKASQ